MESKEKLNNIWAMTDKPSIDVMKKKPPLNNTSSSDTTSESASESDSDFSALPEEFRPNLSVEKSCPKEKGNDQIPPMLTPRKSAQSPISHDKSTSGNATSVTRTANKRAEIQKHCKKSSHPPQNFDVNLNTSRKLVSSGKRDDLVSRKTTNISLNKNKKKSLQFEYVQRQNMLQESHLIQVKFDMRSTRNNFPAQENRPDYETKFAQASSVRFKNIPDVDDRITKQKFCKKKGYYSKSDSVPSYETNNIVWDNSLSLKPEHNRKIKWNYVEVEKRVSIETFADNSRKLKKECITRKKTNNKSEIFCKFNNFRPNETRNDHNSKSNSTCYPYTKNTRSRPKDDKNPTKSFYKENNLHSVNESKVKYVYLSEQDFEEKEIQDPNKTYAKDFKNNFRKQNIDSILNLNSLNETISLPCACLQKPTNNVLQSEDASHIQETNAAHEQSQNIEEQRNCIFHYGKEMSDLIIGSYTALSMLVSFYREWTSARRELLTIFKQLEKNLQESSKTLSKYADIIKVAKSGSDLATNIPNPAVAMTAKIVSIITGLLQTILKSKEDQFNIDDSDKVTRAMIKDTQTTSELHMYVLQCSQQFEETTQFIREFHSDSKIQKYFDNDNPEITTFMKGFLEYKPDHRIFYKKLHKCFCELIQTSSTSFSKSFCEPFTFYSSATEVIEYLGWRFRSEDFDSTSVNYELEAISRLIQNGNNTTIEELHKRIRNCIAILTEELDFRERCMKDISLFDTSASSKKLF